jgi:CheY-like chemotaxis protein
VNNPIVYGPESESAQTGAAKRILVVDDNPDCADSLALLLQVLGHEVKIARDGFEAVAVAERYRPEIVLLDLGLPKLNGFGACRRLREYPWGQEIVIFALTGWARESDRRETQEAGFDGHLVKPVEKADLLHALETPRAKRSDAEPLPRS